MIKGKTPEEIRKLFNIVNDFTPEEEVRGLRCIYSSVNSPLSPFLPGTDQEGKCMSHSCLDCFYVLTLAIGMG